MPHTDQHAPGEFCWIELGTTDQAAAKAFYTTLFGWAASDFPMAPGEFYTMFQLGGRDAAAAYTMRAEERAHTPPHWNLFVSVSDAGESAAKAAQLDGKVLAPAFDVMDFGRMAVIQDVTGAVVSLWQPKRHAGVGVTGDPGALCWADLMTPDPQRAKSFYEGLFGWSLTTSARDTSGYLHIKNGENFIGGIPPARSGGAGAPPHWMIYFSVTDVDAAVKKAGEMGARVYLPPTTMQGVGRFTVLADPQGAVFSLFKQ